MTLFQAAFLGLIQGLTEFLPVSSSGHLVLAQKLMGFETPPVSFDILVHAATLLAIGWWLRRQWRQLAAKLWWLVLVGSIPAGVAGWMLRPYAAQLFNDTRLLGWGWLVTGVWLLATRHRQGRKMVNWPTAVMIGVAQAVAILPSVSRSGATIATALLLGIGRREAMLFSLVLALPAIAGAQLLDWKNLVNNGHSWEINGVGFGVALVTSLVALKVIEKALATAKFHWFGWYCLILGGGILVVGI